MSAENDTVFLNGAPGARGIVEAAVARFALEMQGKLDRNRLKPCRNMSPDGGERRWDNCSIEWLIERAREELIELEEAVRSGGADAARKEAADVGNFMMMVHDNLGRLLPGEES